MMTEITASMPSYPMLALVVRHGGWASTVIALVVALAGILLGYTMGSALVGFAGLFVGGLTFIVVRTLVEMVRLMADMLLPK
jgi:hypothetical protein